MINICRISSLKQRFKGSLFHINASDVIKPRNFQFMHFHVRFYNT